MSRTATATRPKHIQQAEARERERLLDLERQARKRAEMREVMDGVSETLSLEEARGEKFIRPAQGRGDGAKPVRRVSGLDWMLDRKKIDRRQYMAGEKYGARVQAASPSLGSCIDVRERVGMPPCTTPYTLAEVASFALFKLREDRKGALGNIPYLIDVLDQVCAYGRTPRQLGANQRECERAEDRLLLGLDLLAVHYGL